MDSYKKKDRDRLADLGFLTASLAHEIKNPLAALQLSVQTVRRLLGNSEVPAAVREQLEAMEKTILRTNRLANQMLGFAKNKPFCPQHLYLKESVVEILHLYSYLFVLNDISVEENIPPAAAVVADADGFAQVLINLLNNAVRALSERPSDRKLKISAAEDGESLRLQLWNNGPEIPSGTEFGIGLTVSQEIMKTVGGGLVFSSAASETRFTLVFPAAKALQAA